MRALPPLLVLLAWSLWFGGIVMLLIAVNSLFQTFDRPTAGLGATGIFQRFEIYQLILAAVAIAGTIAWRLHACSRPKKWLLVTLLLAALCAVIITAGISPRIDAMRIAGTTTTPQFARLHGLSMLVYLIQALLLLAAGLLWWTSSKHET